MASDRYDKLGLRKSLSRIYQYPLACKELASILRISFPNLPKNLQSVLFQDTLFAFRLLPLMQTKTAVSAANVLLQGAEAVFPKQKKALALTEFKHAIVANKRRPGAQKEEEEGSDQLPLDILVHVFSFLDSQSLVSASLVSRSWNAASSDNNLWKAQYISLLDNLDNDFKAKLFGGGSIENIENAHQKDNQSEGGLNWRAIFKNAYKGILSEKNFTSLRGFCKHCSTIIWLMDLGNEPCESDCKHHQIKPVSTQQIAEYLEYGFSSLSSLSDSDSDSDSDESISKLWAFPRPAFALSMKDKFLKTSLV